MNSSLFIAKKIITAGKGSKKNSKTIIKIATIGTILSTVIMILTIFISHGFKENIIEKVRGFSSDIQILNYDANQSFDYKAISLTDEQANKISTIDNIKSVAGFISKPSILKYKNNIEGIVLKSYQSTNDYDFFRRNIIKGKFPNFDNKEILISEEMSMRLQLDTGQKVLLYFIQDPIRFRKLKVSGIYKTDIYEFDHLFAVVDIRLLQKLNSWECNQYSGFEIILKNSNKEIDSQKKIDQIIRPQYFKKDKRKTLLKSKNKHERYPEFYSWFNLFDNNVLVIISLMIAVAIINLISALLIIIIENTNLIGMLKSFGSENGSIRNIFLYLSIYLALKGIVWGNIIALVLAFLQYYFQIIPLDAKNYYISYVPIGFDWLNLLILDVLSILLIIMFLIIPSSYISRISPIKVIRFN